MTDPTPYHRRSPLEHERDCAPITPEAAAAILAAIDNAPPPSPQMLDALRRLAAREAMRDASPAWDYWHGFRVLHEGPDDDPEGPWTPPTD